MIKKTALGLMRKWGLHNVLRKLNPNHLNAICYHGVVKTSEAFASSNTALAITVEQFEQQIRDLSQQFKLITVAELHDKIKNNEGFFREALISFDDGYKNNLTIAAPILKKYNVPAVFFLSTNLIGTDALLWPHEINEWFLRTKETSISYPDGTYEIIPDNLSERKLIASRMVHRYKNSSNDERLEFIHHIRTLHPRLNSSINPELYHFMDWDDAKTLIAQGFEIGSHTMTHPILSKVHGANLEKELFESRQTIQNRTKVPCRWIAYPNGSRTDYSQEVLSATRAAGYEVGFTLHSGRNSVGINPLAVNRWCVTSDMPFNNFLALSTGLTKPDLI